MAKPDSQKLQEMRESNQIIRTEKLLAMLDQFGFQTRRSGGGTSHIFVWNPDYPEIPTDTIVAETKNPIYQRKVIDACLQTLKIEEAHAGENYDDLHEVEQENGYQVPSHLEVIQGRKNPKTFLRHKEYPQIAAELAGYQKGDDLSLQAEDVTNRAQQFAELLKDATDTYDFDRHDFPNGAIVLTHQAHHRNAVLYPFTPRHENYGARDEADTLLLNIMEEQEKYSQLITVWANGMGAQEIESLDGSSLRFKYAPPIGSGNQIVTTIPLTANGYCTFEDTIRFMDDLMSSFKNNFINNLKQYEGFEATRTKHGTLVIRHNVFDSECEIDDITRMDSGIESLNESWDMSSDDRSKMFEEIARKIDSITEQYKILAEERNKVISQRQSTDLQASALKKKLGLEALNSFQAEKPKTGELSKFAFYENGNPKKPLYLEVMFLKSNQSAAAGKTEIRVHVTPRGLETLKNFAESKSELLASFRPTSSVLPLTLQEQPTGQLPDALTSFGKISGGFGKPSKPSGLEND